PLRNVYLAMLASRHADTIWCVGVKGDHTLDKSPGAFARMSTFLSEFAGRPIRVDSPFWEMTKTDIVAWYLKKGLPVENLLATFSCMRPHTHRVHCGRCPSCLRRWIALANNGLDAPFAAPPWEWGRVSSYYIPAMAKGTYPDHRAPEFFTAMATVGIHPPSCKTHRCHRVSTSLRPSSTRLNAPSISPWTPPCAPWESTPTCPSVTAAWVPTWSPKARTPHRSGRACSSWTWPPSAAATH